MAATLWIDVEDLFEYALHNRRPSGIQRVAFELYQSLNSRYGQTGLIRFVRHNTARNTFYSVSWPEVAAVFDRLATTRQSGSIRSQGAPASDNRTRALRTLVHRLPPPLRASLIEAFRTQGAAFRAWWKLAGAAGHGAWSLATIGKRAGSDDFAGHAAHDDVLLALGSPWSHPNYARLVAAQRARHGLRFALLVHDLSVLRYPEWFDRGLTLSFRSWFDNMLPLCDAVFAVSRATAADVAAYAHEIGVDLPGPVTPLPLATGLPTDQALRADRLPAAGSYVLFVSTIEARKNHMLLFRVWRRMLNEMPREQVPTLVFAGRVGWLVDDLMQQIVNTDYLFGRLVIVEDASDEELAALYRGCLFTVYPSFFEGWGLPVTESLAFGKPCLSSNRTSLPEAGGSLARYIDPDEPNEWYATIRGLLEDRAELEHWEARIRREFRPTAWSDTVDVLLAALRHPLTEGTSGSRPESSLVVN